MNEISLSALLPPVRLLLLGFGNVAQAFLPLLASRSEWLGRELGIRPVISGIGTRSQGFFVHPEGIDADLLIHTPEPFLYFKEHTQNVSNAGAFIQEGKRSGASLLIELTTLSPYDGQPATRHIRAALQAGLNVITANKGPVAYAQEEFQALARRQGVQFRFEATVMDGLPLINLTDFSLQAVGIRSFRALLNSTTNFVLSLIESGYTRDEAIAKAQQLGIAEVNPSYDLEGWDSTLKTTILANTLLEGHLRPNMVKRQGILHLTSNDIYAAAQQGSPFRLVSRASSSNGMVYAEVLPQRIERDDILYFGHGPTGIISLETQAMGTITLIEQEPTVMQTAYGILSDLIIIQQRQAMGGPN